MNDRLSVNINSLAGTDQLGRSLGHLLLKNMIVALIGPLGAGKTHFVRAIADGLGMVNPNLVTSPTFVLIQEYRARIPIFHFDAYRLSHSGAFLDLGVEEYYEAGGVCLIEWADRISAALPRDYLRIDIEPGPGESRRFMFQSESLLYRPLIEELRSALPHRIE